tara:strand:- start:1790 stop:2224 length:435 start_codon:yes stop_codon:yes gene_type:complete
MNLSKLLGNKPQNHILAILLTVFVVFDIQLPLSIAVLIDNILGKIVVIGIALSLMKYDRLIGILALVACIVLIERASNITGSGPLVKFLPNEDTKHKEMVAMNPEFPVSLEEEVIQKMLPYTTPDLTDPEYKPVQEKVHDAQRV